MENKTLMIRILFIFMLALTALPKAEGQTATINAHLVFPNEEDHTGHISFKINGQSFGAKDTIVQIPINSKGLDTCEAIILNDTLRFLTKFRAGETYEIRQGCCCTAFTLTAKKDPRRGNVTFKNTTKEDLGLVVCEHNANTVEAGKQKTLYASESAMCLFKPCPILITSTGYLSDTYNYKNDNRDYDQLFKEQEQLIIDHLWFHFLHGEKVEVYFSKNEKQLEARITGYLTDKEYKQMLSE